jgi:hypothetical protein
VLTMTRTAIRCGFLTLVVLLAGIPARASDSEEFERLWQRYRPDPIASTDDFIAHRSAYFGDAFEFTATIVGRMEREGEKILLVRPLDCSPLQFVVKNFSPVMSSKGDVRLIVRSPADAPEISFELLAIASEQDAAAVRPTPGRAVVGKAGSSGARPYPSRGGSSSGPYSEGEILAAYARAARYFNPRLSAAQATDIARLVIGCSRQWGVDARLMMAVIAAESRFKPHATSRAGAMGLGQLMPATARSLGVQNAYDPAQNLAGSVRLIRGHLERSGGDLAIALAKYNAGPGAVERYGGVPPYRETINYIARVTSLFLQMAPEYAGLVR